MSLENSSYDLKLNNARELFINGKYETCEPMLNNLLLIDNKNPEIFQMLASISYDKGKFNRAIKFFKRALEVDPFYIDASVGLSIIFNDLGRYEEGKNIFDSAKDRLIKKARSSDKLTNELLSKKHEELGDIYFANKRYDEAQENFIKAKKLKFTPNLGVKIAQSCLKSDDINGAIAELRNMIKHNPHILAARQKLGEIYYDAGRVIDAVETWESILLRDPSNAQAKHCLKLAEKAKDTSLEGRA